MTPENIFFVFFVTPHPATDQIERRMVGKFYLTDDSCTILEDHGLPESIAKGSPAEAANAIFRLTSSMHYEVTNLADIMQGHHPELARDLQNNPSTSLVGDIAQTAGGPESVDFEFDRIGGEGPRNLSISDGQVFMDGHMLDADEIERVQQNVKEGKAFLRRKVKKSEILPGGLPTFMTDDSLVPGVGNLHSYRNSDHDGIHVHVDLHHMRHLNRAFGLEIGNKAVAVAGKGLRDVVRNLVGKDARVYRVGEDRFAAHVPNPESAALVARGFRQHLENIPAINGVHRLAASIGIGPSKDHAQAAIKMARDHTNAQNYARGQTQTHVAMNIPGGLTGVLK